MEISSKEMLNKYGISEWNEKSIVLSKIERGAIYDDLKKGIPSPLVALVQLPFPMFAQVYFGHLKYKSPHVNDPTFGYKLYLLTNKELKETVKYLKLEKGVEHSYVEPFKEYMCTPLDKTPKIMSSSGHLKYLIKKYIYLTQYIDLEEAKRLGLNMTSTFEQFGEDGYMVNEKLNLLNPTIRSIIENYYGFNGCDPKTINVVAKILNLSDNRVAEIVNYLEASFLRTYGEMKNKLEVMDPVDGLNTYANRLYRKMDIYFESVNRYKNVCSDQEKSLLNKPLYLNGFSSTVPNDTIIYISHKYLFPSMTTLELSDYLVRDLRDIEYGKNLHKKQI